MFILVITVLPILTLLWWFFADRYLKCHYSGKPTLRWLLALFAVGQIGYIFVRVGGRVMDLEFDPPLVGHVFGYVWFILVVPLIVMPLVLAECIHRAAKGTLWLKGRFWDTPVCSDPAPAPEDGEDPGVAAPVSRRQFLAATLAAAPPIFTLGGTAIAMTSLQSLRLRRFEVPIAGLPMNLDGLRIVQLTDTHVGRFTGEDVLNRMVRDTEALKPDMIVVTGDLIDHALKDLPLATRMFSQLKAPHGVHYVEGNHDLFEGVEEFRRGVRDSGLRILVNEWETVRIGGHQVAIGGIAWGKPGRRRGVDLEGNMAALLEARPSDSDLELLLAHHPDAFDLAREAGIALSFAGHTHGGQLMLTDSLGAGPMMYRYWSGLYQQDGSAMIVSNGVGNWMPLRINAPAEIILTTLRTAV